MKDGDIRYVILFTNENNKNWIQFAYTDEEKNAMIAENEALGNTLVKVYDRDEGDIA